MDYEKVIEDFKSGKLDKNSVELAVDNDYTCLRVIDIDNTLSFDEYDMYQEELEKEYGQGEGYFDIVKILKAAGVNAVWE